MFCTQCGIRNEEGAKFCVGCGAMLKPAPVQPQMQQMQGNMYQQNMVPNSNQPGGPAMQPGMQPVNDKDPKSDSDKKKKIALIATCSGLGVILIVLLIILLVSGSSGDDKVAEATPASTPTLAPTPEPTLEPTPEPTEEPTPEPTVEPKKDATQMACDIINDTMEDPDYKEVEYWSPLAAVNDFNGDGTLDLFMVYFTKTVNEGVDNLTYSVWSLYESGPREIVTDNLYTLVGGNGGVVGFVERDGQVFLETLKNEPDSDHFSDVYDIRPFDSAGDITVDGSYYAEGYGEFDKEKQGKYIVGDTRVEYNEYKNFVKKFHWICKMDPVSPENNVGEIYTFAEFMSK